MNKFCCKHCGMITDNPEISVDGISVGVKGIGLDAKATDMDIHHYHIECPVCLGRTDFTRPKPFPTDTPSFESPTDLRLTLTASKRFGEILQEEVDRAKKAGMNVKVIELPKLSAFKGIPIRYY